MELREIYQKLLDSRDAYACFGALASEQELKKQFREYAKIAHPDVAGPADARLANEAFSMLDAFYMTAERELKQGIYGVYDPLSLYRRASPLFTLTVGGEECAFYEHLCEGEVAHIYRGVSGDSLVYLKLAADPADNPLLDTEFAVLSNLRHASLPIPEKRVRVNGATAILYREVKGITMPELMRQYPDGVPDIHAVWMLERLLSAVGYLHSSLVVHGNIKPDNILINKENHQVSLMGHSFCIPEANKPGAKYKIVNEDYTAPEVGADARVLPAADIFSVGKLGVALLGGDVQTGSIPKRVEPALRVFLRRMLRVDPASRPGDAWRLWTDLIELRAEVYGPKKFITLA